MLDTDFCGEHVHAIVRSLREAGVIAQGVIGEGVYGFVLAATNVSTRRTEAIKVMPPYKSCGVMPVNALREVTALCRAQHHNVAASKGVIIFSDGTTALRMSMYSCTLRTLLERHHRYFLPLDVVQYLFAEIVKGVAAMGTEFGLVHRDLKPENVLIRWDGKQVAVADWGMSRSGVGALLPSDTVFTREVISKYYAPPETLAGTGVYTSTIDVWSLGVILAELVAGKMVFPHPPVSMTRRDFVVQSVFGVLGTPVAPKDVEFFKKICRIDVSKGTRRPNTLLHRLGRPVPPVLFQMLQDLFKFTDRPTVQEVAAREYVQAATFPPAGVPFSSCVTTPRMEPLAVAVAAAAGTTSPVSISATFACESNSERPLTRPETHSNALCGWNVTVFEAQVLHRAWLGLQSLGTIRQRAHVWLVAMSISQELAVDVKDAPPSQDVLAATVSLAAASVMLVQRRYDVPFVKSIQPTITAASLHVAECFVFTQCRGYLPVSPVWADQLITPAAVHIACESVCHGPEIQAIPVQDFVAACHCHAEKDADSPPEVQAALQILKDVRKRIV